MAQAIPEVVLKKAKEQLDYLSEFNYPNAGKMNYLGERKGVQYFTPYYPPNTEIGFPTVYSLDKKGTCEVYKRYDALHIIALFDEH